MARAKVENNPKVTLELSVEEAKYLRELLQNPLIEGESESECDLDLRCAIFSALNDIGVHKL